VTGRKVEISITNGSVGGSLAVGGMDLANEVTGFSLSFRAGEGAALVIDMIPGEVAAMTGDADVRVDESTRDVLVALGWTPPAGDG
jgi:hypothetical protein